MAPLGTANWFRVAFVLESLLCFSEPVGHLQDATLPCLLPAIRLTCLTTSLSNCLDKPRVWVADVQLAKTVYSIMYF